MCSADIFVREVRLTTGDCRRPSVTLSRIIHPRGKIGNRIQNTFTCTVPVERKLFVSRVGIFTGKLLKKNHWKKNKITTISGRDQEATSRFVYEQIVSDTPRETGE